MAASLAHPVLLLAISPPVAQQPRTGWLVHHAGDSRGYGSWLPSESCHGVCSIAVASVSGESDRARFTVAGIYFVNSLIGFELGYPWGQRQPQRLEC